MHVAVSSDGEMSQQEMLSELAEFRICPVMVYEENGKQLVPLFKTPELAVKFAMRNTPKKYSVGTMEVDEEDFASLQEQGFEPIVLEWPNKRQCCVHVLQMTRETETHKRGYRNKT